MENSGLTHTRMDSISMENGRQKKSSGDKFSFPIMMPRVDSDEFEFGCVSTSPAGSPADRLFFNGKLLPHDFPCQAGFSYSRSTRSSSVSSKDSSISLTSSRSSSTNSSSCSSARTSTSESSDRKFPTKYHLMMRNHSSRLPPNSQTWQFMATPALVRNKRHVSANSRNNQESKLRNDDEFTRNRKRTTTGRRSSAWFGVRIFRSFVSTCKQCHAIHPSNKHH